MVTPELVKEYYDKFLTVASLVSSMTKNEFDDKVVSAAKELGKIPFIFDAVSYLLNLLEKKQLLTEDNLESFVSRIFKK